MLTRYVIADLVRNPRRTLSTMVGVSLGVGLFCGVLFFIDGLSASMTQRAVAPLPIDIQRIVGDQVGNGISLTQSVENRGGSARVDLTVHNAGTVAANEVTVRSLPPADATYVAGSAEMDGTPITGVDGNPFAHGAGDTGLNVGTVPPGTTRRFAYELAAPAELAVDVATVDSTYSTREARTPVAANDPAPPSLADLARRILAIDGVESASPLSLGDLGSDTLSSGDAVAPGPAKILAFDADHAARDDSIDIIDGAIESSGVVISAEAAEALGVTVGGTVTIDLPDGSAIDGTVTGVADLTRARSLFSSRRGGDLETFVYVRNSVIVSPASFDAEILPAYERAASTRGSRLKSPPVREVDVRVARDLLDADPATAVVQTRRIGTAVADVAAGGSDYVLDNITNTLTVAADDAGVAKRLFVFLGLPGGFLAAMLAGYAGTVLADAQRREQATLRVRGASRRHLLRMLTARTAAITVAGSLVGLVIGYLAAGAVLGNDSLSRASTPSLLTSAFLGSVGGFAATGAALYLTGRRSIDRDIEEDRARFTNRPPLWRRLGLDIVGVLVVAAGTVVALRANAFDGAPGSVYFGRAVELNLWLLVLPVAAWITGSLLAARLLGSVLTRTRPRSSGTVGRPLGALYRLSVGRRPWAIGNGAMVISLIVALGTSLAVFTASYDGAKATDARFATGADIRITPGPASPDALGVDAVDRLRIEGVAAVTPVIAGRQNVILRSARTSDPADLVAVDPETFGEVAPLRNDLFVDTTARRALDTLREDPDAVLLSADVADFLKAAPGDTLSVLLARATDDQVEVELRIAGLYERLPGFPGGADALLSIDVHRDHVPAKDPDFFLAATGGTSDAVIERAVAGLERGPAATDQLQVESRLTTLASDQSSLAALNIAGLVDLDSGFALAMSAMTIAIFVFGLLLQRRREYITLRAQGLEPRTIGLLITGEAGTVAVAGAAAGVVVGSLMGGYFVHVLRPLFVLDPGYTIPLSAVTTPAALMVVATLTSSVIGARLVNRLQPTELLRDE